MADGTFTASAHCGDKRAFCAAGKLACAYAGLVWRVAGESDSEDDMSLSSEEASDDDVPENKAQVLVLFCGLGALAMAGHTVTVFAVFFSGAKQLR